MRMKTDDWAAVLKITWTERSTASARFAAMVRQRYGRIINIASVVAQVGERRAGELHFVKGGTSD